MYMRSWVLTTKRWLTRRKSFGSIPIALRDTPSGQDCTTASMTTRRQSPTPTARCRLLHNIDACVDAYYARAAAFAYMKRYNQAVADLLDAVRVDAKSDTLNSVAWLLATCPDSTARNGTKATEYITRALKIDPNNWTLWDTRAAVFAENGDFENAASWEERCLQRKDLSAAERHKTTERLALYRARKPY